MTLSIIPLNQRDPKWKSQRLGTVDGTTIGSDGCVITCQSMSMTFHGKPMTPDVLDNFLTDNKLYYKGNLWVPGNCGKVMDGYTYIRTVTCENTPAPIDDIKKAIDSNQPPTLWLINEGVRHNVLAVGYEGNQIIVNDPWRGDTVSIKDRWGNSATVILSVDFYEGPIVSPSPNSPVEADQIRKWGDYTTSLKKLNDNGRYNYYTDEPGRIVDDLIAHEDQIEMLQKDLRDLEQAKIQEEQKLTDEIAVHKTTISKLNEELLISVNSCNDKLDAQKVTYEKEMEANVNKSIELARKMAQDAFDRVDFIEKLPYFDTYEKAATFIKSLQKK